MKLNKSNKWGFFCFFSKRLPLSSTFHGHHINPHPSTRHAHSTLAKVEAFRGKSLVEKAGGVSQTHGRTWKALKHLFHNKMGLSN